MPRASRIPITTSAASSMPSRVRAARQHARHLHRRRQRRQRRRQHAGPAQRDRPFSTAFPRTSSSLLSVMDDLGGPKTYNHYPVGWAHAMGTPFQWTKQVASHFGGTRNGMVISWPKRIKDKGGLRSQFHHVIDIVPTMLEAAGVTAPAMHQRRGAKADRRREHGLYVRRREGGRAADDSVFRDARQSRDLSRRLDRRTTPLRLRRGITMNMGPTSTRSRIPVGALQRRRRFQPGGRSRRRTRRSSRTCRTFSTPRRPSTTCSRSTTAGPAGWTRRSAEPHRAETQQLHLLSPARSASPKARRRI